MNQSQQPIDLLTLKEKIPEIDSSYLVECVNYVPTHHHSLHYAQIIHKKYIFRQAIQIAEKMRTLASDEDINIYDFLERMDNAVKRLTLVAEDGDKTTEEKRREKLERDMANYDGEDQVVSFASVYESLKEGDQIPKFHTGWESLDKLLCGFKPKQLIAIGGIMKHGKTSFTVDMLAKMKEYNPLFIALEEPVEELMEKFMERGEQPPYGFAPRYANETKTDWIEKRIIESQKKYESKVVFVDNLNWIRPTDTLGVQSKPDKYERVMQELKMIAKRLNICLVIIIHLNKNAKADTVPTFDDIMGSATIGQLVDKAVFIWKKTEKGRNGELTTDNKSIVSVQLNRHGGTGNVKMKYENGHFLEYDWGVLDEDLERDFNQDNF
jgi:replicative DNA helicase